MIYLTGDWDIKEEVPTARFWLMTKLRLGWDKRWDLYISTLKKSLMASMVSELPSSEAEKAKKEAADLMITKLERSAWATMPAAFLSSLKVERVIHR